MVGKPIGVCCGEQACEGFPLSTMVSFSWMQRFLLRSILACTALLCCLTAGRAQATTLHVGVYNLPPEILLTEDGQMGGIFGELLIEIAQLEGWHIHPVPCHWKQCFDMLQQGEIDLMPDVIYTPERASLVQFQATPVLETWAQVYAAEQSDIGAWTHLANQRIAILEGSAQQAYLENTLAERKIKARMVPVSDSLEAFEQYAAGRADVVVTDFLFGEMTARRYGMTAVPILFMPGRRHFAIPSTANPALIETIDAYIKRWRENRASIYYQILQHWEMAGPPMPNPWYRQWPILALFGLLLLLLLIGLALSFRFRRGQLRLRQHAAYLELHDNLTGLPNRQVFTSRLEQVLHIAQTDAQHFSALLKINLDGFKRINDSGGHAAGDQLLKAAAGCLKQHTRERDTVSRLGADEFMVLLVQVGDTADRAAGNAMRVAQKLSRLLQEVRVSIQGLDYHTSASFGLALLHEGMDDADTVMYQTDLAMQQAKADGGGECVFYNASIQEEVQKRMQLEQALLRAAGTPQLSMMIQPQIDRQGRTVGAELLMRWQHPDQGPIGPDVFIPLAEESGLILELTRWSVSVAFDLLVQLQEHGIDHPLSVNVSPMCLKDVDFIAFVQNELKRTGVPGHKLIFEVTEGIWIQDVERARRTMLAFTGLGIQFAMDDFGSGYANLAYLKHLPLSELKIDQSLVQGIPDDTNCTAISNFIIMLGEQLHMRVITEGVETRTQSLFLYGRGCSAQQGYLHARPMPIADWLAAALRSTHTHT